MKNICLIALTLIVSHVVMAQKYVPKIIVNTVLNYNVVATSTGQQIPLTLTILNLNDPVRMKWGIPGLGTGTFEISAKGVESATKMYLSEPAPDDVTKLKDNESIMVISKAQYKALIQSQAFELNGAKFIVKTEAVPYKINDKEADVIHSVSANGKVEMWILNNPDFPLICKLTGNPQGIDLDLTTLKE